MLTIQKNSMRILIAGAVILILGLVMFSIGLTGRSDEYTRPVVTATPQPTPTIAPTLEPTPNPTIPATASPEPTPVIYKGEVNSNSRLRSKPSTDSEVVGSIDEGTTVTLLRFVDGLDTSNEYEWYEIVYEDAALGKAFIATQLVTSTNAMIKEVYED